MQKSLGGHIKKFCNIAVIKGNQMSLGVFMCIRISNKRVKISRKNSKWLLRKSQTTLAYTFLPHTIFVRVLSYGRNFQSLFVY